MVRVLAVADEVSHLSVPALRALEAELVLAAGDLPRTYLDLLASACDVPVLYVPGNHDPEDVEPPGGTTEVDRRVASAAGLRVAGLGGCVRYRPGPNQYTQKEYTRRARRLLRAAWRKGPVDVLLTHAPPLGLGDGTDDAHQGIGALHKVLARLQPSWHLHGHVHPYGPAPPDRTVGRTTIRNVIPWRVIEIEPRGDAAGAAPPPRRALSR